MGEHFMRAAGLDDIPALIDLVRDSAIPESRYPVTQFDEAKARQYLQWIIRKSDNLLPIEEGSTFAGVIDGKKRLDGALIGLLQPVYFCFAEMEGIDVFFYVRPGADPAAHARLIDAYEMWAFGCPHVKRAKLSENWITERGRRAGAAFERRGYVQIGRVYEKELRA